eukprot:gene26853-biopygen17440
MINSCHEENQARIEAIAIHQEQKEEEQALQAKRAANEKRLEAILWVKGTKDLEQLNQDGL